MEKENKKTTKIPFGAKDSELYKFEYTIPEGYEARIEDGKVIVQKKESEDERIRKSLVEYFGKFKPGNMWNEVFSFGDVLSYLEKQKEQKWSPSEREMGVLYKLCYISNQITGEDDAELTRLYQDLKREYFNGHSFENMFLNEKQKDKVVESDHDREQQPAEEDGPFDEDKFLEGELAAFLQNYDKEYDDDAAISDVAIHFYELGKKMKQKSAEWRDTDMNEARNNLISVCRDWERGEKTTLLPVVAVRARYFLEHLTEPKPAEWSEEDEAAYNAFICEVINEKMNPTIEQIKWLRSICDRLKSLRPQPHWKPSDEQLRPLEYAIDYFKKKGNDTTYLESLLNDLNEL